MDELVDNLATKLGESGELAAEEIENITSNFKSSLEDLPSGLDYSNDEWISQLLAKDPEAFVKLFADVPGGVITVMQDSGNIEEVMKTLGISNEAFVKELAEGAVSDETMDALKQELEEKGNALSESVDEPALKDSIKQWYSKIGKGMEYIGKGMLAVKQLVKYMIMGYLAGEFFVFFQKSMGGTCTIKSAPTTQQECNKIVASQFGVKQGAFANGNCTASNASSKACTNLGSTTMNKTTYKGTKCTFSTFPKTESDCKVLKESAGATSSTFDGTCCTLNGANQDTCSKMCLESCDGTACFAGPGIAGILGCLLNPLCLLGTVVKGADNLLKPYMWIFYILLYLTLGTLMYRFLRFTGITSMFSSSASSVNPSETGVDMLHVSAQGFMMLALGMGMLGVTTGEFNQLTATQKDPTTHAYPPAYTNPLAWVLLLAIGLGSFVLGKLQRASTLPVYLKYFGGLGLLGVAISQLANPSQLRVTAGVNRDTQTYQSIATNLGMYASVVPLVAYGVGAAW